MRAQYKTSVRGGAGVFPPRQISHICRRQMSIPHRQIHNARAAGVHYSHRPKTPPATAENKMNHIAWSFLTLGIQRVATRMMAAKTR